MSDGIGYERRLAGTRETLARWRIEPRPVLREWFGAAALVGLGLLGAVLVIAYLLTPDPFLIGIVGVWYAPDLEAAGEVLLRNSLVLALHAFACVAGFLAGSALALENERRSGISLWVHERARPVALAWVLGVTVFSLCSQALELGFTASTLAASFDISPALLIATVFPHAMVELVALFLPLAAWTMASRRDGWDELLAATAVTVTLAIPMLLAAVVWELEVWPLIVRGISPSV
ncbi:MAG: stage II sporulation protein M [Solirubrobacterales bacterium]|nr:stage II sporulation protein M [Solirubrobacterales bacterium]